MESSAIRIDDIAQCVVFKDQKDKDFYMPYDQWMSMYMMFSIPLAIVGNLSFRRR